MNAIASAVSRALHKVTLDVETFSRVNLKSAGMYRYAEDESTDLLCVCWAVDDGPVNAWIPSADPGFAFEVEDIDGQIFCGPELPPLLLKHLQGAEIHCWNAAFERAILNGPAGQRYGFPKLEIHQMRCSMARARYCSLPGRLEDSANELNTPVKKRTSGLNAMRYLCKPRADGTRPTIVEERKRFLELVPYCADDVRAERGVDDVLPEMSPKEQKVWELDQTINDRGVLVDLDALADLEHLIDTYKKQLAALCIQLTTCPAFPKGISPTQLAQLSAWIRANGYPQLENLQADTVRQMQANPAVPDAVKRIIAIYATYGMKAVSKFKAIRSAICKDGRLRGMLLYHGAGTGRWSSVIVQIHNLFRPVIDDAENALAAARARSVDWIRALYPSTDPMKVVASCIRGLLIAKPGHELVFPDFSGIESRWNAWMFDEEWKLDAYRKFDRGESKFDNYVMAYARAFGVDPATVTKAQRQLGKVMELSLGYEGGVGAFVKMAATYRVDLAAMREAFPRAPKAIQEAALYNYDFMKDEGRTGKLDKETWVACEALKLLWREAHPRITAGWKQLKYAAIEAVCNPGQIVTVAHKRIMYKTEGEFLIMRLPSGRKVRYFKPQVRGDVLHYRGVDTATRIYGETYTYGGKQCLAAGTKVLTGGGWKSIELCTASDALWDGENWVYSGGLIAQGVRPVIAYNGVEMTSDHEVLTNEGWKTAAMAQSQGLDWAQVRLPNRAALRRQPKWKDALAGALRLRPVGNSCRRRHDAQSRAFSKIMRMQDWLFDIERRENARLVASSYLRRVAEHAGALYKAVALRVEELWWARHTSLPGMEELRPFCGGHAAFLQPGALHRAGGQPKELPERELLLGHAGGAVQQQALYALYRRGASGAGRAKGRGEALHGVHAHSGRLAGSGFAETYDLANAGPLKRFTVLGSGGPMIVHNCENETQAGCRDLLVDAMLEFESTGEPIIFHVHDEPVMEVPIGCLSDSKVTSIMCRVPTWAPGFPLAIDGHRAHRYRK
jgi:DNA polymerase